MKNLTKFHILDCFNELLEEYPFQKITVKMIVEKSEISKATFYRWFIDKYDVMNFSYKKTIDDIFNIKECKNLNDLFYHLLINSKKDANRIKKAYTYYGINSYITFLHDYSYNRFLSFVKETREEEITEEEKIKLSFFCYGNVWTVYDWINDKLDYSAEFLATQITNSIPESVRYLWYKK